MQACGVSDKWAVHGPPASPTRLGPMQSESINLAQSVVEQLSRHVSDVVICPDSRNSPLSLALLARKDIRVHVRLDERSAAFLALGMARVQKRHVAVVMTSGTAVANCLPAMVEAHYAHVPLAVVSRALRSLEALLGSRAFATWDEAELMEVTMISARGTADAEGLGVIPRRMIAVLDAR